MRLKKIKLSGFKSFVDTATVPVDKNLVGIVGPNGCGKSNVIDAVRWVMGESSAKNLRGDSMTDVIFNGSSGRKPVGQASIELVFDNTHNPLVGEMANYSEIAIKRIINREGQSNYYLNNTRCRRKDLADVFLGTGLGPRSYSIIEQGMISRVIEARPEDLRLYLEEAAGISKYKERRRETEIRIKHTRENLDRVNDIRLELTKQLEKLANQAEVAKQYKELKQEYAIQEKFDLGLQYKKLHEDHVQVTSEVNQENINLEALNAKSQSFNTELEHKKIAVSKLHHEQQNEQAKFFKIEQLINTSEQEIKHLESEQAHCVNNINNLEKQLVACKNNIVNKNTTLEQVNADLVKIDPEHDQLMTTRTEVLSQQKNIEHQFNSWEEAWREQLDLDQANSKIINQSQAIIEKHDTLILRTQARIESLQTEQKQLKQQNNDQEIASLKQKHQEIIALNQQKQAELDASITQAKEIEVLITELQTQLNNANREHQVLKGRLSSLETLQEQALGKDQKIFNQWLEKNHLNKAKRLGEIIEIESGWELALETIIRDYIKAVVVSGDLKDQFDSKKLDSNDLALIAKFNPAFINFEASAIHTKANSSGNKVLLRDKITAPIEIGHLLNNIYCANDVQEAQVMLSDLGPNDSIITKDGRWLNNAWFTVNNVNLDNDHKNSILSRENLIKELKAELQATESNIASLTTKLNEQKEIAKQFVVTRNEIDQAIRANLAKQSEIKSELSRQESKSEQQRNRLFQIDQDLVQAIRHVDADSSAVKQERAKLQKTMIVMEEINTRKIELQTTGDSLKIELKEIRAKADALKDKIHKSELQIQQLQQQRKHLLEDLNRLEKQQEKLNADQLELTTKNAGFAEPIEKLRSQLNSHLDNKQTQAQVLASKNQDYNLATQDLTTIEKTIADIRNEYDQLRDKIQAAKLKQQEMTTKIANISEILQEKGLAINDILEAIDNIINSANAESLSLTNVKNKLKQLKQAIDNLGAVNLTAIDEYQVEFQRKGFLDTQEADLQEALTALEVAIAQIDEETKQRFKDTFDFVNEQFQYLFPKVFGGGKASLELSGTDLLDTGVTVMAQPPGKRNATIHLLSGGEKALTAIALVFSIFRLNPAPFCMLDEVDAPLDDANVSRYCNLVKEMSKDVQFIFITHNKVTMTMAEHLIGVTMHEPGVSRLVSVDVDQAVEMVQS